MDKEKSSSTRNKKIHNDKKNKIWRVDFFISLSLAILAGISIAIGIVPITFGGCSKIAPIISICSGAIILFVLFLFVQKGRLFQESIITEQQYKREQANNQVHNAIFHSLYEANSAKIRETLRYTYGSVPKWNPINYRDNVLVYDVHEHIRSILISLKKIVINIDPKRFNDRNVSVELVYCYPEEIESAGLLPAPKEERNDGNSTNKVVSKLLCKETSDTRPWRLISSGDTSGNHSKVLEHLTCPTSFYTLLDCFGTRFANDKYTSMINTEDEYKKICDHINKAKYPDCFSITNGVFFTPDTKDSEYAKKGKRGGSAIGTIICVRNDNPEKVFVKAILTINTYGESLHVPDQENISEEKGFMHLDAQSKKRNKAVCEEPLLDKDGLSEDDYSNLFCNEIIGTYKTLLASELAQMYIRHAIKEGIIDPKTGRKRKKKC